MPELEKVRNLINSLYLSIIYLLNLLNKSTRNNNSISQNTRQTVGRESLIDLLIALTESLEW